VNEVDDGGHEAERVLLVFAVVDGERDSQGEHGDDDGDELAFSVVAERTCEQLVKVVGLKIREQDVELEKIGLASPPEKQRGVGSNPARVKVRLLGLYMYIAMLFGIFREPNPVHCNT
jgi:hypothetical protein